MAKVNELFKQIAEKNAPYKLLNQEESLNRAVKTRVPPKIHVQTANKNPSSVRVPEKTRARDLAVNKKQGVGVRKVV